MRGRAFHVRRPWVGKGVCSKGSKAVSVAGAACLGKF